MLRHHTYFHSTVPFIAATAYLAMYLGTGVLSINNETVFIARYVDWTFTTPLLLAGLAQTALHEHGKSSGFMVSLITLDVIMIITGLLSALSLGGGPGTGGVAHWVWYLWSCCAFLGVLYLLWSPLKAISARQAGAMDGVYRSNLVFLTIVWLFYPVVFLIGPQGIKLTDAVTNVWLILVLDVIAKVVYGFAASAQFKRVAEESSVPARRTSASPLTAGVR